MKFVFQITLMSDMASGQCSTHQTSFSLFFSFEYIFYSFLVSASRVVTVANSFLFAILLNVRVRLTDKLKSLRFFISVISIKLSVILRR